MSAAEQLDDYGRLIEAFEADVPERRSRRLAETNRQRLVALEEWLLPRSLLDASEKDLQAWIKTLRLTNNLARSYRGGLHDFYDWAETRGLIVTNPAARFRRLHARWTLVPVLDHNQTPRTLEETVRAYCWDRRGRGEITERSARALSDRLMMLTNAVGGDLPIGELDRRAVFQFQHAVGQQSAASRRAYLSTVRVFCRWAVAEGLLAADPTAGIAPIREPRRVPRALPEADVARLLRTASEDPRDLALIWLLVGCGLRCAEAARLELADYDERARTIFVRGKAGHERLLPVPAAAARALEGYLDVVGRYPGPLLRPTYHTNWGHDVHLSPHSISAYVAVLMYKAGIKHPGQRGVGAHALRHSCASDVLDRCGNVRTVQAILGHASLATTEIYLRRANLEQMREALEGRTYGVPG